MSMAIQSRGSAIRLLVIILVVGGAAAGVYFFQRYATVKNAEDRMKLYDDALQWRLAVTKALPKEPTNAFTRLQIGVKRDDSDAGDHSIEIGGTVEDQAALDTLNALLATKKPPARFTFNVKVLPTPPLPPEMQEQINKQKEDEANERASQSSQPKLPPPSSPKQ